MRSATKFRRLLLGAALLSAASLALAACSDTSIDSPGDPNPIPPGGGGGTSPPPPSANVVNFVPTGGCPSGLVQQTQTVASTQLTACTLTGNIFTNLTIPSGLQVAISGPVFVGQPDDGSATSSAGGGSLSAQAGVQATLTIQPGATIFGSNGADYLVITRGSKIDAQGTAQSPIVFTSRADVLATQAGTPRDGTSTARGEWGGIVINGRAPINDCPAGATGGTLGCEKQGEGSSGLFGGVEPTDDSGSLKYIVVKHAGFIVTTVNELNGIAFQGVGNATDVDFIQVHNNADDGVEFFGGTVNAKHIVLTGNDDDNLDWTDGWVGRVQFVLVKQAATNGDNGFEMDNLGGAGKDPNALPRSFPIVSNFTLIGRRTNGMLYRAGTRGVLANGIVTGFATGACLDIDDSATFGAIVDAEPPFRSIFMNCTTNLQNEAGEARTATSVFALNANNVASSTNTMNDVFSGSQEQAVVAVNPTTLDPFFDAVSYIGAFAPTETASNNWAAGWTFGVFPPPSCPTGTTTVGGASGTIGGKTVCRLSGNQTADLRLTRGDALIYELAGPVFIGVDRGPDPAVPLPSGTAVTLTIDAGVTVFGSAGADYLVVARGSKIFSNGTRPNPVVFTSRADVVATAAGTPRGESTARGEWGGLVINGRAPINDCAPTAGGTVNCAKSGEGSSGLYGGATATDDSGSLFYTRVQYAGFIVTTVNELNGIAFQGVGNATDVDFIQVHNNADDGVEFFGGTVNAKHIVLTGNDDDNLDWTDGWVGRVQFVIIQQAASNGDNGFEMDNLGGAGKDPNALPRSTPIISNFTVVGQRTNGMLYRAGTLGTLANGVVVGFPTGRCLDVDDAATFTAIGATAPFRSMYLGCTTNFRDDAGEPVTDTAMFARDANNVASNTHTMSGFTFITGATGIVPGASELAVPVINPSTLDPFFNSVSYIGAVSGPSDTWFKGWTFVPSGNT